MTRKNDWSNTTGKHLNEIESDKSKRIDGETFEQTLADTLVSLGLVEEEKCSICDDNIFGRVQVHYHNEDCKKCGYTVIATQTHKCEK